MLRAMYPILLLVPALSACAQDDPDNTPLRGQWETTMRLSSVTLNGMTFAPADLPGELRQFEGTETQCGEPLYTNANWQAVDVARRTGGECRLVDFTHDSNSARFVGQCSFSEQGMAYNPSINGRSTFDETNARDVVTMQGDIVDPGSGSRAVLKMIAVQESRRIGDC